MTPPTYDEIRKAVYAHPEGKGRDDLVEQLWAEYHPKEAQLIGTVPAVDTDTGLTEAQNLAITLSSPQEKLGVAQAINPRIQREIGPYSTGEPIPGSSRGFASAETGRIGIPGEKGAFAPVGESPVPSLLRMAGATAVPLLAGPTGILGGLTAAFLGDQAAALATKYGLSKAVGAKNKESIGKNITGDVSDALSSLTGLGTVGGLGNLAMKGRRLLALGGIRPGVVTPEARAIASRAGVPEELKGVYLGGGETETPALSNIVSTLRRQFAPATKVSAGGGTAREATETLAEGFRKKLASLAVSGETPNAPVQSGELAATKAQMEQIQAGLSTAYENQLARTPPEAIPTGELTRKAVSEQLTSPVRPPETAALAKWLKQPHTVEEWKKVSGGLAGKDKDAFYGYMREDRKAAFANLNTPAKDYPHQISRMQFIANNSQFTQEERMTANRILNKATNIPSAEEIASRPVAGAAEKKVVPKGFLFDQGQARMARSFNAQKAYDPNSELAKEADALWHKTVGKDALANQTALDSSWRQTEQWNDLLDHATLKQGERGTPVLDPTTLANRRAQLGPEKWDKRFPPDSHVGQDANFIADHATQLSRLYRPFFALGHEPNPQSSEISQGIRRTPPWGVAAGIMRAGSAFISPLIATTDAARARMLFSKEFGQYMLDLAHPLPHSYAEQVAKFASNVGGLYAGRKSLEPSLAAALDEYVNGVDQELEKPGADQKLKATWEKAKKGKQQ